MTSIFSKDVLFSSKWYKKTSFESERRNHIYSYVTRTTLTKTDVFLKVRHSHKIRPKWTTYTRKDDFLKKRRLWRRSPFQKSRSFSRSTDAFWQNWPPFERCPFSYKTSVDLKLVRSGRFCETRPIECGNQQIIITILFQNKHNILTYFLIGH